jgi:hypothetical protein
MQNRGLCVNVFIEGWYCKRTRTIALTIVIQQEGASVEGFETLVGGNDGIFVRATGNEIELRVGDSGPRYRDELSPEQWEQLGLTLRGAARNPRGCSQALVAPGDPGTPHRASVNVNTIYPCGTQVPGGHDLHLVLGADPGNVGGTQSRWAPLSVEQAEYVAGCCFAYAARIRARQPVTP